MKEIRLISLEIENFKGVRHLKIEPGGKPITIYGDNGTGKTTIYDALTWLLFDKDSRGASKFEIKPLGKDGRPRISGVIPTVRATLSVNGEAVKLGKSLRERWERKRGSTDKVLTGHTTDYTVDDVPRKENEYKRLIAEMIDENIFRQLTNVYYFCSTLKWQERRKRLFDICNVKSDAEILETAPAQFSHLREVLGNRTVDQYKEMLSAQLRGVKKDLDGIPLRIDECDKAVRMLAGLDFPALREKEAGLSRQRANLQAELVKLENNTLLAGKQAALDAVKNEMRQLDMDNMDHRRSQLVPVVDERPAIRDEIRRLKSLLDDARGLCSKKREAVETLSDRIERCRVQWHEIDAQVFADDGICKLCGQKLPPEQVEDARKRFEEMKLQDQQAVVDLSNRYKAELAAAEMRIADLEAEITGYEAALQDAQDRLDAAPVPEAQHAEDLPDYQERFAALAKQLSGLEAEVSNLRGETANIRKGTEERIAALDDGLREVRGQLAQETTLQNAQNRIGELRQEQRERAAFQEQTECMVELCEDFIRYKVQSITDDVNSRFEMVRFRLFTEQINGGLSECCDATVDGVPYESNLNSAAKINAGLDVIAALSAYSGVKVPLFVDNAESVSHLLPLDTQVIRLVVSEQDKELRWTV